MQRENKTIFNEDIASYRLESILSTFIVYMHKDGNWTMITFGISGNRKHVDFSINEISPFLI